MQNFWTWLESTEPHPTAAVIILKDDKALILRRGMSAPWMPGKWNLAGGGIDAGENPQQAAIRECEEEAGITPVNVKFHKKISDPGFTLYLFVGETTQEPHINYESSEFTWVAKEDLKHYDFVPYIQQEIAMVLHTTSVPPR